MDMIINVILSIIYLIMAVSLILYAVTMVKYTKEQHKLRTTIQKILDSDSKQFTIFVFNTTDKSKIKEVVNSEKVPEQSSDS